MLSVSRLKGGGGLLGSFGSNIRHMTVPTLTNTSQKTDIQQSLLAPVDVTRRQIREADAVVNSGAAGLRHATIVATSFHYLSTSEIEDYTGDIVIDNCEASTDPRANLTRTPNDPRMGTLERGKLCITCNQTALNCPGHPGRIELGSKYIHPEEIRAAVWILDAVCNSCSRLKVTREHLEKQGVFSLSGRARLARIAELSKSVPCINQLGNECMKVAPGTHVGTNFMPKNPEYDIARVKLCLANPEYDITRINGNHVVPYSYSYILKDKGSKAKAVPKKTLGLGQYNNVYNPCQSVTTDSGREAEEKEEARLTVNPATTNIRTIDEIKTIFGCISEEDQAILGFDNEAHPLNLVMESLVVIPTCARPHISVDGVIKMDHLTTGYGDITRPSNLLKSGNFDSKASLDECKRRESARDLFYFISHLIDNSDHKWTRSHKEEVKGCKQRITGKEGYIRMNNMGKRINFGARTVIVPDYITSFGWCSIPQVWNQTLTVPVKVARYNIDYLNKLYQEKKIAVIIPGSGRVAGDKIVPTENMKSYELQLRDTVERYIEDGDVGLINRQPTISKFSMIAVKVKLWQSLTMGLPMMYTRPLNADFDGDEMNLHVPQTLEARAEAFRLLCPENNITSPHTNSSTYGLVFNHLIGGYLMTLTTYDKKVAEKRKADGGHFSELTPKSESGYDLGCEKDCYYAEKRSKAIIAKIESASKAETSTIRNSLLKAKREAEKSVASTNLRAVMSSQIAEAKARVAEIEARRDIELNAEKLRFETEIAKIEKENAEYNALLWSEGLAQIDRNYPLSIFEEKEDNERRARETTSFPHRLAHAVKRYGVNPRSGRALFSALLPEDFWYEKGGVKIRNGILLPGPPITKDHIGVAGNTIHQVMLKRYGPRRVKSYLTLASWFLDWYVERRVFTLTHNDTTLNAEDSAKVNKLVNEEVENAQLKIRSLITGSSLAEKDHREKMIQSFISNVKAVGDRIGQEVFDLYHPLNVMSASGTKGSSANTAQLTGLLGQQFVRGVRPPPTLAGGTRTLPYFDRNSTELAARGFVRSNFARGVTPPELFALSESAREGLTDTATKTADVGAILHRMIKVMEDVKIAYTGANVNAVGNIFQYIYHDGFDAAKLLNTSTAAGSVVSFIDLKESIGRINLQHEFSEYA